MWQKHKKLTEWTGAGLISNAQADAIESYEAAKRKGHFGRGLAGLSVFAILCGVVSIIASNWQDIPDLLKIAAHAILNMLVAAGLYRAWRSGNAVWREGLVLALFGLTLTFIILVGQIYQMGGTVAQALLLWMLVTLPLILVFAQSLMTAVPWMLAFLATVYYVADQALDSLPPLWQSFYYIGLSTLLPLALMGDGSLTITKRIKPVWAALAVKTGLFLLTVTASISTMFWLHADNHFVADSLYNQGHAKLILLSPLLAGLAAIAVNALLRDLYRANMPAKAAALFAVVSVALCSLPILLMGWGNDVVQALVFIAYWIFIGWLAQGLGWMRVISLAIIVIAIRIFAVYVQVFGTMLDTGIGLIVGGVVMIALLSLARRLNKRLTKREGN